MADETGTRAEAEAAAKIGAEIAQQFSGVLKDHKGPVHADVIARLMGRMLACMSVPEQAMYLAAVFKLSAVYTIEYERLLAAHKAARKH